MEIWKLFRQEQPFGKAKRSRVEDILTIFVAQLPNGRASHKSIGHAG